MTEDFPRPVAGKTALVTGGTGGLGRAAAADMSCQAEGRTLPAAACRAYLRLDVLASNVGGFWATRHLTADGLERIFAVNHSPPWCLLAWSWTGSRQARPPASSPSLRAAARCRPPGIAWRRRGRPSENTRRSLVMGVVLGHDEPRES
jgi:NAD(P)-dependent dehydrogenase (short-subunit alcohol dehydrogenase family)